jgi:predicted glycosyltransferase
MPQPTLRNDSAHHGVAQVTERKRRIRIALYSHDTMGMGHIRRNLLIASSIVRECSDVEVLLIAGTREAAFFSSAVGLDCVTLPALAKDAEGRYAARNLGWSLEETTRLRARIIHATLEEFTPDVFVVDKLPRGIGHELVPTLECLQRNGTKCVLGLRDVLDEPLVVAREWARDANDEAIDKFYDELWIYGDQAVYDCLQEYRFSETVASRAYFTGYLNQADRNPCFASSSDGVTSDRPKRILCVVGGGQDGFALAKAFVQTSLPTGYEGVVITGPFMPKEEQAHLHRLAGSNRRFEIIDRLVETDDYLHAADRVIAMGGYNTITSVLSFHKAALIVPRIHPRQEQWIRAERLAQRGCLSTLSPLDLSSQRLQEWMHAETVPQPFPNAVDLLGLNRISQRISNWASAKPPYSNHDPLIHKLRPA